MRKIVKVMIAKKPVKQSSVTSSAIQQPSPLMSLKLTPFNQTCSYRNQVSYLESTTNLTSSSRVNQELNIESTEPNRTIIQKNATTDHNIPVNSSITPTIVYTDVETMDATTTVLNEKDPCHKDTIERSIAKADQE